MISFTKGNLLESQAEALVNTVNTVGVMGKGIALQFKERFPENFKVYKQAVDKKLLSIGKLLVHREETLLHGSKLIINFPTKIHWRNPSKMGYIELGLDALRELILNEGIRSIAIPPLGAGNGGLNWNQVRELIVQKLEDLDCEIIIYEPSEAIQEALKKERVKLTPARAMLLAVLYDLVKHGEFVSEFSAEKIAYFLQRFGAEPIFKLNFEPNFYGPYSGKVRHVLHYLNGSYVRGFQDKNKKPFEEMEVLLSTEPEVLAYLENHEDKMLLEIVNKTMAFLHRFYSPYALELLSTVDYIMQTQQTNNVDSIVEYIRNWNTRKKTQFTNSNYVELAVKQLEKHLGWQYELA